jgi:hypothetical protein
MNITKGSLAIFPEGAERPLKFSYGRSTYKIYPFYINIIIYINIYIVFVFFVFLVFW